MRLLDFSIQLEVYVVAISVHIPVWVLLETRLR